MAARTRNTRAQFERRLRSLEPAAIELASHLSSLSPDERLDAVARASCAPADHMSVMGDLRRRWPRFEKLVVGKPVARISGLSCGSPGGGALAAGQRLVLVTEDHLLLVKGRSAGSPFESYALQDSVLEPASLEPSQGIFDSLVSDAWDLQTPQGRLAVTASTLTEGARDSSTRLLMALGAARVLRKPSRQVEDGAAASSGRPARRLLRSYRDAEQAAAEWMTYLGFGLAYRTPDGADGGLDVIAARGVAQVKMEALPTGRPVIQQLHGCAVVEKKAGVVFSLAGFTLDAIAWADRADLALFQFDLQGDPEPMNHTARSLISAVGIDAERI